ncbi:uncharacterized protein N7473_011876 [Penicillium subrubescens]|uniref:uncharacterized protein n=1 Tax=Penicillium subrubescens TaxID=1316194 RepID=UPI00254511A8|nr:uncharacterized protein N7473_011876 [Penicillium subrubescens]KAJ5880823.1 hypothetical protein N7473_011876 [Penicillium subrubescens]
MSRTHNGPSQPELSDIDAAAAIVPRVADEIAGPALVVQLATRKLSSSPMTKRSCSAAVSRSLLRLLSQLASGSGGVLGTLHYLVNAAFTS